MSEVCSKRNGARGCMQLASAQRDGLCSLRHREGGMARARQVRPSGQYGAATPSSAPLRLAVPLCCRPPATARRFHARRTGLLRLCDHSAVRRRRRAIPTDGLRSHASVPTCRALSCSFPCSPAPASLCAHAGSLCAQTEFGRKPPQHSTAQAARRRRRRRGSKRGGRTTVEMMAHWRVLSARSRSCFRFVSRSLRSPCRLLCASSARCL
jgi:hypothetical protein